MPYWILFKLDFDIKANIPNTFYLFDGNFFLDYNLFPDVFHASLRIDKGIGKPTDFEIS
jgi:hypothetical protein